MHKNEFQKSYAIRETDARRRLSIANARAVMPEQTRRRQVTGQAAIKHPSSQ